MQASKKTDQNGKAGPDRILLGGTARRINIKQLAFLASVVLLLALPLAPASNIYSNQTIVLNGTGVKIIGGNLDAGNNRIANLGTPSAATDAAPRSYADSTAGSVTIPAENVTPGTFPAGSYTFTGTATGNALTVNGTVLVVNGTTGYVGVGVAQPAHRLEIPAGTTAGEGIAFGTGISIYRQNTNILTIGVSRSLDIVLGGLLIGGTEVVTSGRLLRAADGSVSSPAFTFISDTDTGFYRAAENTLGFATGGVSRVTIDSIGNVGINTTTPGKTLSVQGDVNITGNLTVGGCLNCTAVAQNLIILWRTTSPPSGYTYTGLSTTLGGTENSWVAVRNLTQALDGVAVTQVNSIIYAIGGHNQGDFNTTYAYDPGTNLWSRKADMPTARGRAAIGVVDGIIYVAGGSFFSGGGINKTEAYNPSNNSWSAKSNLPVSATNPKGVAINNNIYVFSGNRTYSYTQSNDSWSRKADLPEEDRAEPAAAAAVGDTVYVIGGRPGSVLVLSTSNYAYNTTTNTWSSQPNMTNGRSYLAAVAVGNTVYAIGGDTGSSSPTAVVEAYTTTNSSWSRKANMGVSRFRLDATAINNTIYAVGGSSGGLVVSSNEMYSIFNTTFYYMQKT